MATPTTLPASFTAGQILTAAQQNALRGAFRVLQVVSTNKTDTFTTTSTSYVDITGLSASITPSASTNKVLIIVTLSVGDDPANTTSVSRLMRDATAIDVGDAAGSRIQASGTSKAVSTATQATQSYVFLDSPATTSATTYKVQAATLGATFTFALNRSADDSNTAGRTRTVSNITVMEISA
jgi:hypothetical protein